MSARPTPTTGTRRPCERRAATSEMASLAEAMRPIKERLRELIPEALEETAEERADRLKRLPPTELVDRTLTQLAAAHRDLPAVGMVKARARIEKKIAELEEQHRQCVERDVARADFPDNCFCFGPGEVDRCAYNGARQAVRDVLGAVLPRVGRPSRRSWPGSEPSGPPGSVTARSRRP